MTVRRMTMIWCLRMYRGGKIAKTEDLNIARKGREGHGGQMRLEHANTPPICMYRSSSSIKITFRHWKWWIVAMGRQALKVIQRDGPKTK